MKYELTGKRFGKLVVIREIGLNKWQSVEWLCKCDCGNYHITQAKYLMRGDTVSCGCKREKALRDYSEKLKKHGMANNQLYRVWQGMRGRCNNKKSKSYKNYGGRGIKVCPEWNEFLSFYNWAINNGYEKGLSIDRIDVNGNYEPKNCRWADSITQGNNTRRNHYLTYNGETKTMSEWARIKNLDYSTLRSRINEYNWSVEKALETPARIMNRSKGE